MSTFSSSSKKSWDKLGVFASLFCAIHCLSAPLLFIFLPAFAEIWGHRSSHIIIALLVLPLASTVLFRGYRQHRRRWILITTVIGITAVLASYRGFDTLGEVFVVFTAAIAIYALMYGRVTKKD